MMKDAWKCEEMPDGIIHVHPLNDTGEHILFGESCPCSPKLLDGGKIVSHEAFDGRQWQERAEEIFNNPDKYLTPNTP